MLTRAEWCPPGGLRKRSLEMMNGNVNGMTIRLLGCALAEGTAIFGFVVALLIILFLG